MHKMLSKIREDRARDDRGFTLIELLVVVVILGVLIAIAIPLYLNYRKGANDSAAQSDLRNAISVMEVCNTDNSGYPVSFAATTASPISPCGTVQKINLSAGTSMTMNSTPATSATSYVMWDNNSGGSGKYFCYDSKAGGAVKTLTASPATTAAVC